MKSKLRAIKSAWKRASERNAALLAAGVAFYTVLSLFPAMIAAVLSYGLFVSPPTIERQSDQIAQALPDDAASIVTDQMHALTATDSTSLGWGLVLAIVLGLYGASAGVANLLRAMRSMFDDPEQPGFLRSKIESLAMTAGALVIGLVVITLVAAAPAVFNFLELPTIVRSGLEAARWLLLAAVLYLSISALFNVAQPHRNDAQSPALRQSRTPAVVATALWILVSVGFSLYVNLFGNYSKTYGALAGVVALLMWLWIGLFALLLGISIRAVVQPDSAQKQSAPPTDSDQVPTQGRTKETGLKNATH